MWAAGCPRCVQSFTEDGGCIFLRCPPIQTIRTAAAAARGGGGCGGVTVKGDVNVDVFQDGGVSIMRPVAGTAGLQTDVMKLWGGYILYTRPIQLEGQMWSSYNLVPAL